MSLDTRFFLSWREAATLLGYDDEGLRQAMLVRLQHPQSDIWLPVAVDSKGYDYLVHLRWDGRQLQVSRDSKNFDEHGKDVDLLFDDGSVFPNRGRTETASWDATHNHRTGWSNCYLLSGRLVLDPYCVRYACDDDGDLRGHGVTVVPREWCVERYPNDGFEFRLIHDTIPFRSPPAHLYTDCFFYAEDVRRIKDRMHAVMNKHEGNDERQPQAQTQKPTGALAKPIRSDREQNLLRVIAGLWALSELPEEHNKTADKLSALFDGWGWEKPGKAAIADTILKEAANLPGAAIRKLDGIV